MQCHDIDIVVHWYRVKGLDSEGFCRLIVRLPFVSCPCAEGQGLVSNDLFGGGNGNECCTGNGQGHGEGLPGVS